MTTRFSNWPSQGAKICGIRTQADYDICRQSGAAFVGCVFFEKSPRHLSFEEAAHLANIAQADGPRRVALTVNADDAYLQAIYDHCQPDMFQLHGDESPERIAEIKSRFTIPVMKAFRVKSQADIKASQRYYDIADWLLFDADSGNPDLPGGTGHQFDWSLVSDLQISKPWMLAGGLTPDNVADAKAQTSAHYFDVSSAVESQKGVKDHNLIQQFVDAVK